MLIPIVDLLKLAEDIVGKYLTRLHEARERRWEQVLTALEMLTELTGLHVKAINEVVEPVVERRDLLETCRRYRLLVNNPDLPRGYGEARGVLEAALKLKQFRGGKIDDNPVKDVLTQLSKFQRAAFLLRLKSTTVVDMLEVAEEFWSLRFGRDGVRSDSSPAQRIAEDRRG
jgi:hypothetical protein